MGWWSCTILGGDSPLDLLSEIEGIINYSYKENNNDDDFFSLYPLSQMAKNDELRESIKNALIRIDENSAYYFDDKVKDWKLRNDDKSIFYQIICSIYMASGTPIEDDLLKNGIDAGKNDSWASESDERASYIDAYLDALKGYNHENPIYENTEGLFSKLAELRGAKVDTQLKWLEIKDF
jgi:hypothetical protein